MAHLDRRNSRKHYISLTIPCGGDIGGKKVGGAASLVSSRSGGCRIVGQHVPSVPAVCPGCLPSCSDASSLAGCVGVVGSRWWGRCPSSGWVPNGSWGLLLMGLAGPSSGSFSLAICWSVGLLVMGCVVAAAPLSLRKEARHVSACVAGQDAGPSWCWVQVVTPQLCVVMSHKSDCHFREVQRSRGL